MAHSLKSLPWRPVAGAHSVARSLALQDRGLQPLVVAAAAAYLLLFVVVAGLRAAYAFPIDAIESGALLEVRRILAGQPLYTAPTLEYVPFVYGPVYFYAAALASAVVGPGFLALRLVSLLSSIRLVHPGGAHRAARDRQLGPRRAGQRAAGRLRPAGRGSPGQRADGRAGAVPRARRDLRAPGAFSWTGRRTGAWRGARWPGVLMALAVLTKQTSGLVAVGLVLAIGVSARRQLAPFGGALVAVLALGLVPLLFQSGRWPLFYLWELPRHHVISLALLPRFWDDVLGRFTLPLVFGAGYLVACARAGDRRRLIFFGAFTLGMLGVSWASRSNSGGARNVDLPAYAALCVMFALAVHMLLTWLRRTGGAGRGYVLGLALAQLVVMINNPRALVPYLADTWAGPAARVHAHRPARAGVCRLIRRVHRRARRRSARPRGPDRADGRLRGADHPRGAAVAARLRRGARRAPLHDGRGRPRLPGLLRLDGRHRQRLRLRRPALSGHRRVLALALRPHPAGRPATRTSQL